MAMDKSCMGGACAKCRGGMGLIVGLIILANAYWMFARWDYLIGGLLALAGLAKLMKPCCGHCE